jgi:oxalate decarboxylase/phosphoglucose isomerase-like protein (cupin superfamily)
VPPGGSSGEAREDRFPAGGAHWAPQVMVHEIRNIGAAPFWAIVVEHA